MRRCLTSIESRDLKAYTIILYGVEIVPVAKLRVERTSISEIYIKIPDGFDANKFLQYSTNGIRLDEIINKLHDYDWDADGVDVSYVMDVIPDDEQEAQIFDASLDEISDFSMEPIVPDCVGQQFLEFPEVEEDLK